MDEDTCLAFATICFARKPCRVHGCTPQDCFCQDPCPRVCYCDDWSDGGRKPHIHWDEYDNDKTGIEFVDDEPE